jgi:Meiotically up-regulated gene 113
LIDTIVELENLSPMDKLKLIDKLKLLASERGGHIGIRAFVDEIGLSERQLRDLPWYQGWNALLKEVGLETKSFKVDQIPPEVTVEAVAEFITRSGKWPTEDELRREKARNSAFPGLKAVSRLRKSGELARMIVDLGAARPEFAIAAEIATRHEVQAPDEAGIDEKIRGYVYMLRSGRRYKIGKTSDRSRRFREVGLLLPDETSQVHSIPTDDPSGIEAYWKHRFAEKRVRNTEFFSLTAEDVRAFKRRKYQ